MTAISSRMTRSPAYRARTAAGALARLAALCCLVLPAAGVAQQDEPDPAVTTSAVPAAIEDILEETTATGETPERSPAENSAPVAADAAEEDPPNELAAVTDTESNAARPPVAENVDLSEPFVPAPEQTEIDIGTIAPPPNTEPTDFRQSSLIVLGTEVEPMTSARLSWSPDSSFASIAVPTPVLVVNGALEGPTMCVTAAIHGDELNGIEVVRRVLYELDAEQLTGAVIGVPIVNLQGFRRASRYLPDRRDLNRFFPGNPTGSSASRLAHSFFSEVIAHCDALVDVHTGSFQRTNLPQLRADLGNPDVVALTRGFGSTVVLHSPGAGGTLRRAATEAGIPTVTLETGAPAQVQEDAVSHGATGVMTLLDELEMYETRTRRSQKQPVYYRSKWERADRGGVLFSKVALGDRVRKDQLLGTITDPITNVQSEIRATRNGRILGMALDQFVLPGFAAYRIGIEDERVIASDLATIGMPAIYRDVEDAEHVDDLQGVAGNYSDDDVFDARDSLEDSEE